MGKLLAHARSYGIELFCLGFPGVEATQVWAPYISYSKQIIISAGGNTGMSSAGFVIHLPVCQHK